MKRISIAALALSALLVWMLMPAVQADAPHLEMMTAQIDKAFRFGETILLAGQYQLIHDDALKAKGEPCLSIWRSTGRGQAKRTQKLASSYCHRVSRDLSKAGNLQLTARSGSVSEVTEVQFPGSDFAHIPQAVPAH